MSNLILIPYTEHFNTNRPYENIPDGEIYKLWKKVTFYFHNCMHPQIAKKKLYFFPSYYFAIHICVPNSWYISLRYLSCEKAQRYQPFGTKIWMAEYLPCFLSFKLFMMPHLRNAEKLAKINIFASNVSMSLRCKQKNINWTINGRRKKHTYSGWHVSKQTEGGYPMNVWFFLQKAFIKCEDAKWSETKGVLCT